MILLMIFRTPYFGGFGSGRRKKMRYCRKIHLKSGSIPVFLGVPGEAPKEHENDIKNDLQNGLQNGGVIFLKNKFLCPQKLVFRIRTGPKKGVIFGGILGTPGGRKRRPKWRPKVQKNVYCQQFGVFYGPFQRLLEASKKNLA